MDPFAQVVVSAATVIAAAVVAIVVGSRKGLADVEARSDAEMARLVDALEGRVKVLTDDLAYANTQVDRLRDEVKRLSGEIANLQKELTEEKRITARIRDSQ